MSENTQENPKVDEKVSQEEANKSFSNFMGNLWSGIKAFFISIGHGIQGFFMGLYEAIKTGSKKLWGLVKPLFDRKTYMDNGGGWGKTLMQIGLALLVGVAAFKVGGAVYAAYGMTGLAVTAGSVTVSGLVLSEGSEFVDSYVREKEIKAAQANAA